MGQIPELSDASGEAFRIAKDIRALPTPNTAAVRNLRRRYSRQLKQADPALILRLAKELIEKHDLRWPAYELIRNHPAAFQSMDEATLEKLGQGIHSWGTVDTFARILAGPAWLHGLVSDNMIHGWAHSKDLWWRRAALVSTVALNMRSQQGRGDVARTLAVCSLLVADREEMVVKAMSWALRALVVHDPAAVAEFLSRHEGVLPARVKREVRNKLTTGLKNGAPVSMRRGSRIP